eukprot:6097849-Pleurochrysis_carterae.AAC.1
MRSAPRVCTLRLYLASAPWVCTLRLRLAIASCACALVPRWALLPRCELAFCCALIWLRIPTLFL